MSENTVYINDFTKNEYTLMKGFSYGKNGGLKTDFAYSSVSDYVRLVEGAIEFCLVNLNGVEYYIGRSPKGSLYQTKISPIDVWKFSGDTYIGNLCGWNKIRANGKEMLIVSGSLKKTVAFDGSSGFTIDFPAFKSIAQSGNIVFALPKDNITAVYAASVADLSTSVGLIMPTLINVGENLQAVFAVKDTLYAFGINTVYAVDIKDAPENYRVTCLNLHFADFIENSFVAFDDLAVFLTKEGLAYFENGKIVYDTSISNDLDKSITSVLHAVKQGRDYVLTYWDGEKSNKLLWNADERVGRIRFNDSYFTVGQLGNGCTKKVGFANDYYMYPIIEPQSVVQGSCAYSFTKTLTGPKILSLIEVDGECLEMTVTADGSVSKTVVIESGGNAKKPKIFKMRMKGKAFDFSFTSKVGKPELRSLRIQFLQGD